MASQSWIHPRILITTFELENLDQSTISQPVDVCRDHSRLRVNLKIRMIMVHAWLGDYMDHDRKHNADDDDDDDDDNDDDQDHDNNDDVEPS